MIPESVHNIIALFIKIGLFQPVPMLESDNHLKIDHPVYKKIYSTCRKVHKFLLLVFLNSSILVNCLISVDTSAPYPIRIFALIFTLLLPFLSAWIICNSQISDSSLVQKIVKLDSQFSGNIVNIIFQTNSVALYKKLQQFSCNADL